MNLQINGLDNIVKKLNKAAKNLKDSKYQLSSDVDYADMVGRKATQLPVHHNRWVTIEDAKKRHKQSLPVSVNKAIKKYFDQGKFNYNPLDDMAQEHLEKVKKDIIKYPPELPNQKYKRTFKYGKSWKIVRTR